MKNVLTKERPKTNEERLYDWEIRKEVKGNEMSYYKRKQARGNWTTMFTVYLGIGMIIALVLTSLLNK
jgi:hypothetical protein